MHNKLAQKYYGSFKIKKISPLAYMLILPEDYKVYPTIHISKLKRFVGQIPEESQIKVLVLTTSNEYQFFRGIIEILNNH